MNKQVKTTCPYCGVGCGVVATVNENGVASVAGDPDHPSNYGRLCSKGAALAETIDLDGRILHPQLAGRQSSWDEALDHVAQKFSQAIAEHGPGSVAFYVSGQLLTEDYYVANKLMKGCIGSANIDTNSRLCMSSSVTGHRRAFGADTVPGAYEDLELADLVILTGSNLAWCHPVLYQRLVAAKANRPNMKVVVIDPRRTMTTDIADLHLALRPDSDIALFLGLLSHLASCDAVDQNYVAAHTSGFCEAIAASAIPFDEVVERTGLPVAQLQEFYRLFAVTEKVVTCYSQGVNQSSSGTDKVNAILNCHLATGRIGRPGMGPFSLTGQPNAMGGREVGGLANMLAAHMAIENPEDRDRVQRFWGSPVIAAKPGLKAVELFQAVADGRIKALWIMATNPVVSMPDADAVKSALQKCPFVVVSDILMETDTTRHAHVLLPSLGWGEKSGTVTNSERRISRQRAFLDAPGEARADWWQLCEVGIRMGFGDLLGYSSPAEIFSEHASLSAFENVGTRDFDIGAYGDLKNDAYDVLEPFQWPQRTGQLAAGGRFFGSGGFYHPDGRARFIVVKPQEGDRTSDAYPFTLNTGRIRDHWHTMTRTGKSARLSSHIPEPFAELHPSDAASIGLRDGDLVEIESLQGRAVLRGVATERQERGSIFVPMHWNDRFAAVARVNMLVPAVTDPLSGQPASKNVGVRAHRLEVENYGFAVSRAEPADPDADYWALAKITGGWRMEFAFATRAEDWTKWCRRCFAIPDHLEPLGYVDAQRGDVRLAFFQGNHLLAAFYMAREPVGVARSWASEQLAVEHSDLRKRVAVLAGRAGANAPDPGPAVCSCFGVGAKQIVAAVAGGCRSIDAIGEMLNAGTNCGSCRGEIGEILNQCVAVAAE
ncbi:MAG: molybdopterin-dependent oxidoreductase [Pseudorhizobium sp.]